MKENVQLEVSASDIGRKTGRGLKALASKTRPALSRVNRKMSRVT